MEQNQLYKQPTWKERVKLIRCTTDPEELIEIAGRRCHLSETDEETRGDFIKRLIRMEHFSVLEHASASFDLSNMSRACSHQLVRHRIASYSQRSQRFTNIVDAEDFVLPPSGTFDDGNYEIYKDAYTCALAAYNELLANGVRPEDARYVLPAATTTSMILTMNFSALRHFFEMRISRKAQLEIRTFAWIMLLLIEKEAPNVFEDIHDKIAKDPKILERML